MNINRLITGLCVTASLLVTLSLYAGSANATTPSFITLSQQPLNIVKQGVDPNIFFLMDDTVAMQNEWMTNLPVTFGFDADSDAKGSSTDTDSSTETSSDTILFTFGYPQGDGGVYGTSGSNNLSDVIPGFNSSNLYGAQFRSSYFNSNYYNPAVTYIPWACPAPYPESSSQPGVVESAVKSNPVCQWYADANFGPPNYGLWVMPNADPNHAFLNPYEYGNSSAPVRALNVWNDDYSGNPTQGTKYGNGYIGSSSDSGLQWYIYDTSTSSYLVSNSYYDNGSCHAAGLCPDGGFWPAVYWNYTGNRPYPYALTSPLSISDFQRVQICPPSLSFNSNNNKGECSTKNLPSYPSASSTNECPWTAHTTYTDSSDDYIYVESITPATTTGGACTPITVARSYTDEMQNFANWFSYYRSRINMARAGASLAFMNLPSNFRVDFSTVSEMAGGNSVTVTSTEPFTGSTNGTSEREHFLSQFFQQPVSSPNTSLRLALQGVGQWLEGTPSSSAPWGSSSEEQTINGNAVLSCRPNYTLLVSADDWNGNDPTGLNNDGNVDGADGTQWTSWNGKTTYGYTASLPWMDNWSNTLADVAQYYWENDLQPSTTSSNGSTTGGLPNDVPVNTSDKAFWQHMVTYTIGLGITPTLVQVYMTMNPGVTEADAQKAVYQELGNGTVSWPQPGANSAYDADDLWHAAVDGHGVFFSAQNPQQFEQDLLAALDNIVERTASGASVATNTQKAGQVRTDTQVYQALYHPLNWWGQLLAEPILTTSGVPQVATYASWDASCVLTGGSCSAMQNNPTITAEAPSSRVILTDQACATSTCTMGMQPEPFEWNSSVDDLSAAESAELTGAGGTATQGMAQLAYLRGDRSNETAQGGTLRTRTGVLGDIVHASPVWVGYADQSFPTTWKDQLYQSTNQPENSGAQTYAAFESANWDRLNVVYAGSNDGMLHGFEAGSFTKDTTTGALNFNGTYNHGTEVLAFVPRRAYQNLLSYTSPTYQHHYFVDATPGTGDVFYGGEWHTWLADGLGAGGKELFVLDINQPGLVGPTQTGGPLPTNFSESTPDKVVMADWTGQTETVSSSGVTNIIPGTLTCVNDSNCAADLGDTFGTPEIRRFHNGEWGIIWGNGYNSDNGEAGIFIGLIDPSSTTPTSASPNAMNIKVYWIGTGYGPGQDPLSQNRPDGIAYVNTADLDSDHIVDYAYAGDLFGNVWRFNLTSTNPADWHVSTYGGASGTPLYTAINGAGVPQPITTQIQVVSIPSDLPTGQPQNRLLILFGTGRLLSTSDSTPDLTSSGVQSLYGIWDWGMYNWDKGYTTTNGVVVPASARLYAYLKTAPSISRSSLLQQSISSETYSTNSNQVQVGLRQTTQYSVQWADIANGTGTLGSEYGWYMDLVSPVKSYQGEMVVYNPDIQSGVFVVNTTILGQQSVTCGVNDNGGWTMALDPSNGAMLQFNAYAINNIADYSGAFETKNSSTIQGTYSGITVGAVGSPAYITYNGATYMVVSTASGKTKLIKTGFGAQNYNERVSWLELR